jgi:RND family efflux transporter MFP subunit
MITTRRFPTVLLSVAVLTAAAGCGHHEAEQAPTSFNPVSVTIAEVERTTSAQAIEVRGIVQPARVANVSSRAMGPIVAVHVTAGSAIAKGQKLLEIQPEAAEGQLAQTEGALAQAKAAHALAERNYRRFEALHAEGAASDLELDMARMEFDRALGAVEQADGAVEAATSVAGESVVRAPFSGRVVDTLVELGDLAAPGRPLVRVESTDGQQIWLTVREADIGRLKLGQSLGVTIDARPDVGVIDGTVEESAPSADPATHTFTVKVGLPGATLPTGLSGRARITGDLTDRLVVPCSAIHRRGGLELAVVRSADGTARTRAVTTGRSVDDGRVEVLSGLDEGEQVVVDIPGPVADGTPLEVAR